ncbi:MAG: hypothetical protein WCO35_00500 [Candidatus Nomurabacteria bacterium]
MKISLSKANLVGEKIKQDLIDAKNTIIYGVKNWKQTIKKELKHLLNFTLLIAGLIYIFHILSVIFVNTLADFDSVSCLILRVDYLLTKDLVSTPIQCVATGVVSIVVVYMFNLIYRILKTDFLRLVFMLLFYFVLVFITNNL